MSFLPAKGTTETIFFYDMRQYQTICGGDMQWKDTLLAVKQRSNKNTWFVADDYKYHQRTNPNPSKHPVISYTDWLYVGGKLRNRVTDINEACLQKLPVIGLVVKRAEDGRAIIVHGQPKKFFPNLKTAMIDNTFKKSIETGEEDVEYIGLFNIPGILPSFLAKYSPFSFTDKQRLWTYFIMLGVGGIGAQDWIRHKKATPINVSASSLGAYAIIQLARAEIKKPGSIRKALK